MFEVFLTNRAEKAFKLLEPKIRTKIAEAIDNLRHIYFPIKYDVKKLKGFQTTYRIRIGNYRIIYQVDFIIKHIFILSISLRKKAYKKG